MNAPIEPPPADRFCDLVLTGGVTSGVLYPTAVCELARHYRFHALGGTSVGAIAAAIAAAAEYQRRLGSDAGFDVLARVPETLAKAVPRPRGRVHEVTQDLEATPTTLLSLFHPNTPAGVRLLRLFLAASPTARPDLTWVQRVRAALPELWRSYGLALGLTALLLLAVVVAGLCAWLAGGGGWATARTFALTGMGLIGSLLIGAVVLAALLCRDLRKGVLGNHLGLCTGLGQPDSGKGLTDWLHDSIQWAAGRLSDETPMTFRDLAEAPEGELPPPADPSGARRRSIDLRMVTTCLSHGRPYELPLADGEDSATLYFALEEWQAYFPRAVIDLLRDTCAAYEPGAAAAVCTGLPAGPRLTLLQMPRERMPLVVASRLSLSFPGIFSTVPAWRLDLDQRCWRRVRFSDGGICANFPIHLFDAAVPRWPTFGILLDDADLGSQVPPHATMIQSPVTQQKGYVWMPRSHREGAESHCQDLPERGVLAAVFAFIAQVLNTARRWQDYTLTGMPGVRERVVRISLARGEGELDLRVSGDEIQRLGQTYGRCAAGLLLDAFLPRTDGQPSPGWSEHRWIRWNLIADGLRQRLAGLTEAAESAPHSPPLAEQIESARHTSPFRNSRNPRNPHDPHDAPLADEQRAALATLLDSLSAVERQTAQIWWEQPYQPEPRPRVTVRPGL
ncbi:patatin-like phospholipase family protein [Sphaerotilus mobilis]|uniref:Patatin-like phospholipase n=1 Tax=Sphaerotilus mobilis TaxID=47994 RepID=A0A4Q7LL37_9BURK|nr:patatin-like phospholipase family protein [Sphaerotilus mobilis]RZS54951.1 patatin-like phospholipase [Sphaerotilus mobilis]